MNAVLHLILDTVHCKAYHCFTYIRKNAAHYTNSPPIVRFILISERLKGKTVWVFKSMKHMKCSGKGDDDDGDDKEIAVTPATHLGLAGHCLTLQIRL